MSNNGDILPASEGMLIDFSSYLARAVKHSTIKLYLSAVRNLYVVILFRENFSCKRCYGASFFARAGLVCDIKLYCISQGLPEELVSVSQ